MGVTRVGTVCVVLGSGDEERRVRGTGGVSRSGGDRGVEPIRINLPVQLSRDSFNGTGTHCQYPFVAATNEPGVATSSTLLRTRRQSDTGLRTCTPLITACPASLYDATVCARGMRCRAGHL